MLATAILFPTALFVENMNSDQSRTAAAVYSGMFLELETSFRLLWCSPLYLIAFLLAFLNLWASAGMCFALVMLAPGRGKGLISSPIRP